LSRCADTGSAERISVEFVTRSNRRRRQWSKGMRKYLIEREMPKVGQADSAGLRDAARTSNKALASLGPDVQWIESFVADDKTFCVYLARDEAIIRKHAEISGFPASKITEIRRMIDPTTASAQP
jgi:hypothetical protein